MQYTIHLKPNARQSKIEQLGENEYAIWVTVVPENGKANSAAIKMLAKEIDVAQSRLSIIRGIKSRTKIIAIL